MKDISLDTIKWLIEEKWDFSSIFSGDTLSLNISYTSSFPNTKFLREFIDILSDYYIIPAKWKTRLVLIVDELNNNAIEYGSKIWDTNYMKIEIKKTDNVVDFSLFVEDAWTGSKTKKASEMYELQKRYKDINYLKHHSIRGRGLFLIILKLVDSLIFKDSENGGLIVWFSKNIPLKDF